MRVNLLGRPNIVDDSERAIAIPTRGWVLLTALVIDHPQIADRDALVDLIFPEWPAEAARASFRQLIKRLKNAASEQAIGYDIRRVWAGEATSTSDLTQILATDALADEAAMYRLATSFAPLLDGESFDEVELQMWLETRRERLLSHVRGLVIAGAQAFPGALAIRSLFALAQFLPDDPILGEALVKALVAEGRVAETVRVIAHFDELVAGGNVPKSTSADLVRLLPTRASFPGIVRDPLPFQAAQALPGGVPRIILMPARKATFSSLDRRTLHLVDSLIEDMSLELAASHELAVVAPHTAGQIVAGHQGASSTLDSIEYVLETRVRLDDDTPLLNMQLLRTPTREIVWADQVKLDVALGAGTYPRPSSSLIVAILGSIERAELTAFRRSGTPSAYRHYLVGRHQLKILSLPDLRRARKWFKAAGEMDPFFARAFSWYAHTWVLEWLMMTGKDPESLKVAEQSARKAIDLDPNDANGYRALARAALFRGALGQSLEWFAEAERFAPHFADSLADYADTLMHNSMIAMAKEKIDLALHLNPLPPDTYLWIAAGVDFLGGDFESALSRLRRMNNPDQGYRLMAASAAMLGDTANALKYRNEALSIDPTFEILTWTQRVPLKDSSHLELYATALKKAGFP